MANNWSQTTTVVHIKHVFFFFLPAHKTCLRKASPAAVNHLKRVQVNSENTRIWILIITGFQELWLNMYIDTVQGNIIMSIFVCMKYYKYAYFFINI